MTDTSTNQPTFDQLCQNHCDTIAKKLKGFGFVVENVTYTVDEDCEPAVGFTVTIRQKETEPSRAFIEWCLKDYAYTLTFVQK